MTILAGVFSRSPGVSIPDSACRALRTVVSRDPADARIEFRDARAFFVKIDVGAFDVPAHRTAPGGSFAMLAGEPLLLCLGPRGERRDAQLEYLHAQWDDARFESLRTASGTFCAAHYDPRTGTGHLIADRLGLRPLYYAVVQDFVYFASALRILENLDGVPKTMDVLSVVEMTGFGYPFKGGTAYAGITMLEPCEIVTIRGQAVESSRYFAWDSIAPSQASEEDALAEAYAKFESAVRRRLHGDTTAAAYLSGGLDSRCVVAAAWSEGVRLHTFNFSLPDTQDEVFGREFATRIGANHHDSPTARDPDWSGIMADALRASPHVREQMPEHPRLVWSGEGGSVGLGHVYITPEIVSLLRLRKLSDAVAVFLRQQRKYIQTRILNPALAARFRGYLESRLCAELEAIRYPDPIRALFIFLILNGPRRHLEGHFDSIDRHRIELQMPFNDSDFLEYVTGLDVEACLYHRFYVKWLSHFDPAVLAVPWQAYPGHVQSTAPVGNQVPDQWSIDMPDWHQNAWKADLLARSSAMLADGRFPRALLRKSHLQLMRWIWKLNLGNYDYALKAALTYYHYWKISGGSYELPDARTARALPAGD